MKTPNIYIAIIVGRWGKRIYSLSGLKTICSIIDSSKYNIQIQEQRDKIEPCVVVFFFSLSFSKRTFSIMSIKNY